MRRISTIAFLLAIVSLAGCNRHGKKLTFKKGEVFYKSPVTKAEATKLGKFLVDREYFNDHTRKSVQLLKVGGVYQIKFVVRKKSVQKREVLLGFQAIGSMASGVVFNDAPVEVHFADKRLKTRKKLGPFRGFGTQLKVKKGEVFYRKSVPKAEAEALARLLEKEGYFDGNANSVQLIRKGEVLQVRFVVNPTVAKDPQKVQVFKRSGAFIQRTLFSKGNDRVEVHLCDPGFNTVKVIR